MPETTADHHEEPLRINQTDGHLVVEVTKRSGTLPGSCLMCLSCSGGCPFYTAMDYGPHGIMRRIHLGLREEVLTSRTIWFCVGCHTCSAACPMAIDIGAVMDALRQMSLEEGKASQPGIVDFHREVLRSIERHGRTHKLEIMMRHKVLTGNWFQDMDLGLRMLAKRKLDLMPSKVRHPEELKKLFLKAWRR